MGNNNPIHLLPLTCEDRLRYKASNNLIKVFNPKILTEYIKKIYSYDIYSYGYKTSLPLPSIPPTPDTKLELDFQTSGMATSST